MNRGIVVAQGDNAQAAGEAGCDLDNDGSEDFWLENVNTTQNTWSFKPECGAKFYMLQN